MVEEGEMKAACVRSFTTNVGVFLAASRTSLFRCRTESARGREESAAHSQIHFTITIHF